MGIFTALGSALGTWIGGPIAGPLLSAFGGAIDSKKAHKQTRYSGGETQKQESRINFQQMADDARAAGFNPLTALRTTGGMGNVVTRYYTPLIDNGKFGIADALAGAYSGYSNFKAMEQQKKQLGLETDLIKSQIALNKSNATPKVVEDIYAKYNDTDNKVPVNFLGVDFVVPKSMAEYMDIKPNQSLHAGIMTELKGEGQELFNFFSQAGFKRTFGITSWGSRNSDDMRRDTISPPPLRSFTVSNNVVQQNANEIIKVNKFPTLTDNPYGSDKISEMFENFFPDFLVKP